MAMLRKEFERQYGITLLPVSASNICVGDIWDWEGLLRPVIQREFSNVAQIGPVMDSSLYQDLVNIPMVNASIPDLEMKDTTMVSADLKIPALGLDLSSDLKADKVLSFRFQNMTSKDASGVKPRILNYISQLKATSRDSYANQIKNRNVVMWLFYSGAVTLEVDKNITNKAAIDAKINAVQANVNVDTSSASSIKYTISGNNGCPFAAQFIKGKDL